MNYNLAISEIKLDLINIGYNSEQLSTYQLNCKNGGYSEQQILDQFMLMYKQATNNDWIKYNNFINTGENYEQQNSSNEQFNNITVNNNETMVTNSNQEIGYQTETTESQQSNSTQNISVDQGLQQNQQTVENTQSLDQSVLDLSSKIREKQQLINNLVYELSLLQDQTKIGPFMNENHLYCPSYKNLIPEMQNVISHKRKMTINKFWFEKYRPEVIEEVIFPNQIIKEQIQSYVDNGYIGGHCMFYGPGGVGKTTVNIILMNTVLRNIKDQFILDRKIESVDKLKGWLNSKPIGRQKIVIAEEFDRLSDAAQTELKNGLLEKYQNVIFLASSNKLHKIDSALISRFTLVAKFDTAPVDELFKKCKFILTNERIQFLDQDLLEFIEGNKTKGLRSIINLLQLSCHNNIFDKTRTSFFIGNSGTEFEMINYIKWYISYLVQLDKQTLYNLSYNLNTIPDIANARGQITYTLNSNYSINLDFIFDELLAENLYLPVKNLIQSYYQDLELKKIPVLHFEAMLNDIILEILKSKDIYR